MSNYGAFSPEVLADGLSEEQLEAIEAEFGEALQQVADGVNNYRGLTFVHGVQAALAWVLGESDNKPLTDTSDNIEVLVDQADTYRRLKKPSRTVDPEFNRQPKPKA